MINLIEKAITLATSVHIGQRDKGGQPYILHPLRVMLEFDTELERVVAVLHDVFEDHPSIKPVGIKHWIGHKGVIALEYLTLLPEQNYLDYIRRLRYNELAKAVKEVDIMDNLLPTRLALLDYQTGHRLREKYRRGLEVLRG